MGLKTKMTAFALTACMVLTVLPSAASAEAAAAGKVTRINVQGERSAAYLVIRQEFAAKNQEVKLVYNAEEQTGDLLVDTQGSGYETTYGTEGYGISSDDGVITIKAAGTAGASYGLRDVLKQLESGGQIAEKEISKPFQDVRALFVDCARKYFDVAWFESIIREMAWNGMNTLYLSFSNDEGFRFLLDDMSVSFEDENGETKTYDHEFMKHLGDNPHTIEDSVFLAERNEGASDVAQSVLSYDSNQYLTQSDMVKILSYANAYGVKIIPEFNSPGHTGQLLWYFPEYRNVGKWGIATNPCYGLNLENQEAKNFASALIKKYIDFFYENGCTGFCVGGDEFEKGDSTNETIAAYVNGLAEYVESKGMTAYAWVDGQSVTSGLLKKSVVVNDWDSNGSAASDYQVVNFNSDYMYYVLKASGDWWLVNPKQVFETWNPLIFHGNSELEPGSKAAENVRGACMAVWCDDANAKEADVILRDMMTDLKAFGYRVWNYDPSAEQTVSYEDFIANAASAAALEESDVLGAVNAMKEILQLQEQLQEASRKASDAQTDAGQAQTKLTDAERRVTEAEQKTAAAKNPKEKLEAEAGLYTARAEANKLAAEAAKQNALAARLKAAALTIEARILTLDGNTQDAAAKNTEITSLETTASQEESAAREKQNAQAGLDQSAQAKRKELAAYKDPSQSASTTTVKQIEYRILDANKKTAVVTGAANKNLKTATIRPAVSIGGVTYKVVRIQAKAFKGFKNLRKVTFGKNIKNIDREAFAECSKLSNINMKKAKGITSIGKKAFRKINAKAKVTVPAAKKAKYKNLLKKAGLPKKATVK